jgi:hypothetical protein
MFAIKIVLSVATEETEINRSTKAMSATKIILPSKAGETTEMKPDTLKISPTKQYSLYQM